MSMLKKFIVAAVLVSTATPVLASDTSDDARAARQAGETASETRRAASGSVDGDAARRDSKVEGTDHPTGESTRCDCRCPPNAGYWSDPEPLPDYGG